MTDSDTYDAYGLLLNQTGTTVNPYLYRGEQYDPEIASSYLRARYYHPGIGRFLTTDAVEGFPTDPMSLHRYLYGNNNPIYYFDPSGKITLHETLMVASGISVLSTIPLSILENMGWGMYSWLAEYVLPEAYVVGFNITGTLPYMVMTELLQYISIWNGLAPISLPLDPWVGFMSVGNGFVGFGAEALLSVGSAEAAVFKTISYGAAYALPTVSAGLELYDGFVYNLWNAKDYTGPFESLTLTGDQVGSWSLFWDGNRGFAGPWGGARPFLAIATSLSFKLENFSMGRSHIDYTMIGEPDQSLIRGDVIGTILTSILAAQFIKAIDEVTLTPLAWGVLESSIWVNTGFAHHYWNMGQPHYNIDVRRDYSTDRPDEFHSGPSIWRLPTW